MEQQDTANEKSSDNQESPKEKDSLDVIENETLEIPLSLPKYTIRQIREMKELGIEYNEILPKTKVVSSEKPLEITKKPIEAKFIKKKEAEKGVYYSAEAACQSMRPNQICEYRKRNNSRWIGNCTRRPNSKVLYCK